jgi:hypothetical protein
MATVQSTYSERLAPNPPGTIASTDFEVQTGICETAGPGGIPFGRAVSQGTLSDQGVVLGGTAAGFRGISVKVVTLGAEHDVYLPPNNVDILEEGDIWVEPSHAVAAQDPVYFVGATGLLTNQPSSNQLIKGAHWKTSCGTGGRAVVTLPDYKTTSAG